MLILAVLGTFYPGDGGALYTAAIVLYALTAGMFYFYSSPYPLRSVLILYLLGISGMVASAFYKKLNGDRWAWNIVLTASLYALPLFIVASVVNIIAATFHTTSALPFSTLVSILAIWLFGKFFLHRFTLVTLVLTPSHFSWFPSHRVRRHHGTQNRRTLPGSLPNKELPTRDSSDPLVQASARADGDGWIPSLLRHLHRALLRLH